MKLQLEARGGLNAITAYGDGFIVVNEARYESGLILLPDRIVTGWAEGGFAALAPADFEQVRELRPEVVMIGTGRRQQFPHPALVRPLIEAGIGFEAMDLQAACRTYNILMAEGRRVAAALLFA